MGPNQIYTILHSKANHKQNRQRMQWEEIFASNAINKRLTSKIHKQLIELDNKTTYNPIEKMGRRPKQTFLQRRYMNEQQTDENMLNVTNY